MPAARPAPRVKFATVRADAAPGTVVGGITTGRTAMKRKLLQKKLAAVWSAIADRWARVTGGARDLAATAWQRLRRGPTAALALWRRFCTGSMSLLRRLQSAGLALVRFRPSARFWTVVAAVPALLVGAGLMVAPLRELATGRSFELQSLLTFAWLATGAATFVGGAGVLLRAPSFRWFLQVAFVCSLPLPVAFGWRTGAMFVKMRSATEPVRKQLEPWVSGGLQVSLFFLAVSAFLIFLLRLHPLRTLPCTGSFLGGRIGPAVGGVLAAAVGSGVGYSIWLLFRWLGFTRDIELFRTAVQVLPIEYYFAGGALLGAGLVTTLMVRRRRRSGSPPRAAVSGVPAPAKATAPALTKATFQAPAKATVQATVASALAKAPNAAPAKPTPSHSSP